jgi:hypothetical protein
MNLVPLFASLSKLIVPPWASMTLLHTASPKPWPWVYVVNSGVKILGFNSSGMPTPVSSTIIFT